MKREKQRFFNDENTTNKRFSHENRSFKMYIDDGDGFQEDEKLIETFEGTYTYDYDITIIDKTIIKRFDQDKKNNLISLQNKLNIEKNKIEERQTVIERKNSRRKIEIFENKLSNYKEDTDKTYYIEKTKDLLNDYKKLGSLTKIISFTNNYINEEVQCPENEQEQNYRHKIIFEYLQIARKYIQIDLIRKLPNLKDCCDEPDIYVDESGVNVCNNCGLEKINIVKTQFYADGCRLNSSKNNYEDRANFEKVLMRFQGKQINKPSKKLYEKLNTYFISRGLKTSQEYNDLPLLKNGTKEGTSREMMFEALSNINCSGYYDDINLICSIFFGWKLPNITHLEDEIMKDYDEFQKANSNLPNREGRKSSLNSQWILYILLLRRGYPCKSKNFKIPSTPSILEYHKIKTKETYNVLGWECPF